MKKEYISGKYNPFELNAIWFDSNVLKELIPESLECVSPFSFYIKSIALLVKYILQTLLRTSVILWFQGVNRWRSYDKKVVFVIPTNNNQKAVKTVLSELGRGGKQVEIIDAGVSYQFFPMITISLFSFLYLLWLTNEYRLRDDFVKRIMLFNLSSFVFSPGVTRFYKKALLRYRPECVVLANDHMYYCKCLELVCEEYGIRTIYVQHASVSYAFPELHFTYSFLDGIDSFRKYTGNGKKNYGCAILLGALRYDALSSYRVNRDDHIRDCIGVAINDIDDNAIVNDFCNKILERYPNKTLRVRSHPALKNKPFVFDKKDRIIYKCATDESIVDYLDRIDIQLSGDSGVHFDAIIGGVASIGFNFSVGRYEDNYGYVKNGLIQFAETTDEVYRLLDLKNQKIQMDLINYYDASYGKSYAGSCSRILSEFIVHNYDLKYLVTTYGLEKYFEGGNVSYIFPR